MEDVDRKEGSGGENDADGDVVDEGEGRGGRRTGCTSTCSCCWFTCQAEEGVVAVQRVGRRLGLGGRGRGGGGGGGESGGCGWGEEEGAREVLLRVLLGVHCAAVGAVVEEVEDVEAAGRQLRPRQPLSSSARRPYGRAHSDDSA